MSPYVINREEFRYATGLLLYAFTKGDIVWVMDIAKLDSDGEVTIYRTPYESSMSGYALPSALTPYCVLPEDADVNAVVAFLTSDVPVAP